MTTPPLAVVPYPRVPDLPPFAADYQHVLRGPRHRWWRPLLSVVIAVASLVLVFMGGSALAMAVVAATGHDVEQWLRQVTAGSMTPGTFFMTNVELALLVPVAMFAVWVGHGVPGRYVASVAGRLRWGWLARCLVVLFPLWVVYVGIGTLLDGWHGLSPSKDWAWLLVVMVLTTPLQCAGEEFFFRGWVLQTFGSWCRPRWLSMALPTVISCAAFGAAHGSADPWILADLAVFATTSCLLAWRTGGLEAGIAMHVSNNVVTMLSTIAFGGFDQGFISGDTKGSPVQVLMSLVVMSIAFALITWQARRTAVQRQTVPQVPAAVWDGVADAAPGVPGGPGGSQPGEAQEPTPRPDGTDSDWRAP